MLIRRLAEGSAKVRSLFQVEGYDTLGVLCPHACIFLKDLQVFVGSDETGRSRTGTYSGEFDLALHIVTF